MVSVDRGSCTGCGLCELDCIGRVIRVIDGKAQPPSDCLKCGHCVAVCPAGAVSIPEYGMDQVEDVRGGADIRPEELLRLIKLRRSVRRYRPEKIDRATLDMLFQAGRYTPTAKNNQDCGFILVQDELPRLQELTWRYIESLIPESRSELSPQLRPYVSFLRRHQRNKDNNYLFRNAPAVLFIASAWDLDAGLAAQSIALMAASLGLGTMYNGYLQRLAAASPEIRDFLGAGEKPVKACMLLGWPDVKYLRSAPRREAQVTFK